MTSKILQININHARDGHDLMLQRMMEEDFGLAIVPEPYVVPMNHPQWYVNDAGTVALTWRKSEKPLPCTPLEKGQHHVAVKWGDMVVIGVYMSPNMEAAEVDKALEELDRCVNFHSKKPVIVGGDFNAKASLWESPVVNPRGTLLSNWASNAGMICLNHGGKSTCIRSNGESIVDITFANQTAAARAINWEVSMTESASDHRYIEMEFAKTKSQVDKENSRGRKDGL